DDGTLGDDLGLGPVEPVQQPTLVVQGVLGRVLVLGAVALEGTTTETCGLAPRVVNGEQQALSELLLQLVDPVDEREAPVHDILALVARLLQSAAPVVPLLGGPSELEPAHRGA